MKILVVCQFYYPENFTITTICEDLVKKGHEVDVLTGKPNYGFGHVLKEYQHMKEEWRNGVHIFRTSIFARKKSRISTILNYLSFWKNSKKWVNRCHKEYDRVFAMSLSPVTILSAGALYKKKHHVPYIVHCVDLWPESVIITHAVKENSLVYRLLYKWSRHLYLSADRILVSSPSFTSYFRNVLKIENTPIEYVPQCSLVENIPPEILPLKGKFNIVYCGNIGTIQLIEKIPEVMSYLKEEDITFHLIGMGAKSDEVKKKIAEYGVEKQIIFYGGKPFSQVICYLNSADALYVSLTDQGNVGKTIPNKLNMYMAFGKPIIALLSGDGKAVCEESQGALICQYDAKDIAKKFVEMKNMSEKQRQEMGKRNRDYYLSHFSTASVSGEIEKNLLH